MTRLTSIIAALDELLEPAAFEDLGPNGLQVPGASEISRVVTGVTAQRTLVERAVAEEAQLVLVHHGLFWDFLPTGLSPVLAERLRPLFKHDIALAGYHLPLDAHPEVGNNAILAERLGCERHEAFGTYRGRAIGRAGTFAGDGIEAPALFARVRDVTGREPTVFDGGPARVRRIGIVSGAGADALPEAIALGLDAFLTGEPREHVMAEAREAGIHFIAAGHYATETFGVRALGDWLGKRFGVEHVWVDIPNPV
ncbi:MAG: Nif3-like dinuclear metal center hexameric protein [Solirubrobacteraceae bacterium]